MIASITLMLKCIAFTEIRSFVKCFVYKIRHAYKTIYTIGVFVFNTLRTNSEVRCIGSKLSCFVIRLPNINIILAFTFKPID